MRFVRIGLWGYFAIGLDFGILSRCVKKKKKSKSRTTDTGFDSAIRQAGECRGHVLVKRRGVLSE
jgi:hypothetical protein